MKGDQLSRRPTEQENGQSNTLRGGKATSAGAPEALISSAVDCAAHHALGHLHQLSPGQLHPLRVPLDAHQTAPVRVLRDPHGHLVLLLNPVYCGAMEGWQTERGESDRGGKKERNK